MTEIKDFGLFSLWGDKNHTNMQLGLGFYRTYVSGDLGDHLQEGGKGKLQWELKKPEKRPSVS